MSHSQSITTAIAVLLLAAPLGAQSTPQRTNAQFAAPVATTALPATGDSTAERTRAAGPVRSAPALDSRTKSVVIPPVGTPMPAVSTTRSVAMMVVGGAALIVGAVVGGDSGTIIMIGGGALGLYGLWNYLK